MTSEACSKVQQRLMDAGVLDVKFAWSPTVREDVKSGKVTVERIVNEATFLLEQYLDGNVTPLPLLFDDTHLTEETVHDTQ